MHRRRFSLGSRLRCSKNNSVWALVTTSKVNFRSLLALLRCTMTISLCLSQSMRLNTAMTSGESERCPFRGTRGMSMTTTFCSSGKVSESMKIKSALARFKCYLSSLTGNWNKAVTKSLWTIAHTFQWSLNQNLNLFSSLSKCQNSTCRTSIMLTKWVRWFLILKIKRTQILKTPWHTESPLWVNRYTCDRIKSEAISNSCICSN